MLTITNIVYILLCILAIRSKILAEDVIKCKNDEYFDPSTGNCDKCKPICDISNCSHVCPYYKTNIPESTNVHYDSTSVGLITGFLVGLFVILVVLMSCCLYKRYCKNRNIQNKNQPELKTPLQAIDDVQEREQLNMV